jgi:hypothetical protein
MARQRWGALASETLLTRQRNMLDHSLVFAQLLTLLTMDGEMLSASLNVL